MTRRTNSRRSVCVSVSCGPVSANVRENPAAISVAILATDAASRRWAPPKSVAARMTPALAIPMQISLARQTASMKTSELAPPVAPRLSAAMIVAV
jgi:hypothetical protein